MRTNVRRWGTFTNESGHRLTGRVVSIKGFSESLPVSCCWIPLSCLNLQFDVHPAGGLRGPIMCRLFSSQRWVTERKRKNFEGIKAVTKLIERRRFMKGGPGGPGSRTTSDLQLFTLSADEESRIWPGARTNPGLGWVDSLTGHCGVSTIRWLAAVWRLDNR